jgi:hypothetical protein
MNLQNIPPDLQAAVLCEDVRTEVSGQQTLVGVINVVPAPAMPIGFFKLCLWTRWCGGAGQFEQASFILSCEDDQPIAQTSVKFSLLELESHVTNVHVFGGVQFPKYGIYHVEIHLDRELKLRFPLPVIAIPQKPQAGA